MAGPTIGPVPAIDVKWCPNTIGFGVGWVQYFLGDYQAAVRQYEETLKQDPDFVLAPWFLGPALVQAGRGQDLVAGLVFDVFDVAEQVLDVAR